MLDLRSICEGHIASVDPLGRNAHVTTVIHETLQPFFHSHWDELREPIGAATKRHARQRREIDEETMLWLERTVAAFMTLDEALLDLYKQSGGGPLPWRRPFMKNARPPRNRSSETATQ